MTTPSNELPERPLAPQQPPARAAISASRRMYWLVRRELWENRSIYVAPMAVSALALFGFLLGTIHLRDKMTAALALDPTQQRELIAQPYVFAALIIMFTTTVVGVFYCLDALQGERRDRSILFWKSLPVSDLGTVLSKASIPLVVLPLITFATTVVTHFIMLLMSSVVLMGSELSVATLWTRVSLFQMSMMLLYHLVTVHALWYAPIYGWLLLVSGWARRAAFLWAGLPLLAVGIVEKIAFNTSHFAALMGRRLDGVSEAVTDPGRFLMDSMTGVTPGDFLSSPGLWIGLALTAIFLAAAVRMRRDRGPI
jgi:ABC-2 type transport system permease protein